MSQIGIKQAKGAKSNAGSTSASVTLDADPVVDAASILLACVLVNESPGDASIGTPTGFTLVKTGNATGAARLSVFYKYITAGQGRTVSSSLGANRRWMMWLAELTKVQGVPPYDTPGGVVENSDVSQFNSGQTTLTKDEERVFAFFGTKHNHNLSNPSNSFIERFQDRTTNGTNVDVLMGVYDRDFDATHAPVGPTSMTVDYDSTDPYVSAIVSLIGVPTPKTYAKSGSIIVPMSAKGEKVHEYVEAGSVVAGTKLSATRSMEYQKYGTAVVDAILKGVRPGYFVKTGIVKMDAVVSAIGLHLYGVEMVRDTTKAWRGGASAKLITMGTGPNQGAYTTFVPTRSGKHTGSIYTWADVPLRLRITDDDGNNITVGEPVLGVGDWQRLTLTTDAILRKDHTYRLCVETSEQVATTYWIDGVQVEQRSVASEYVDITREAGHGSVGQALRAAKPAALVMEYLVLDGQTFRQLRDRHTDFDDVNSSYGTFDEARSDLPIGEE